jgi:hypothetical protein
VDIDESNLCEGHLRLGLVRTSNLLKSEEDYLFSMFLGVNERKSENSPKLIRNEWVLSRDLQLPKKMQYTVLDESSWKQPVKKGRKMGYVFDRKQGNIFIFGDGKMIVQINDVPLEEPMEWMPAFSVGPSNQISMCQDLSFNVHSALI